jgi:hypothetical protein
MAKKKTAPPAPEKAKPRAGFDEWRDAKRGSEVKDAHDWRTAYLAAIDSEAASPDVMAVLMNGQSKERSLWKYLTDAKAKRFSSFEAFCAAPPPFGLGKAVDELRRLRRVFRFNASMRTNS